MRTLISALICISFSPFIFSQQLPDFYSFSDDVRKEIDRDSTPIKYQKGAALYSFIENYPAALETWDRATRARIYQAAPEDSLTLKNFTARNAREYILDRSKNEQILIINEAHHNARHRAFTRSLLAELYKNGYRHLGLEALDDEEINNRNYAVKESGFYTNEPEFGNLIHEAKKIGFTVFGYEASEWNNAKEREIEQAQHIHQFMQQHPEGKTIIHCGFDHVYEGEVSNWEKAMAGRLKEFTGIDPFTIDQVRLTEKSKPEYSHYFITHTQQQAPFILVNNEDIFNGYRSPKQTDIMVIHPLTRYEEGRPDWLKEGKKAYRIPKNRLNNYEYPLQVLAFRAGEYEQEGIPADVIEIPSKEAQQPLFLLPGTYKVIVRNKKYEIQEMIHVKIKQKRE